MLKLGTETKLSVHFTTPSDARRLTTNVKASGILAGRDLEWPGWDKRVCGANKNIECPVTFGQKLVYESTFKVLSNYPLVSTKAKFFLYGNRNTELLCFEFPIRLIAA